MKSRTKRTIRSILRNRDKKSSPKGIIGYIVSASGLKGYLKFKSDLDTETLKLNYVIINGKKYDVQSLQPFKKGIYILKLDGVNDRTEAEKLIGKVFYDKPLKLPKNSFLYSDIKGCRVYDQSGKELGTVVDILNQPSSFVLEVKYRGRNVLVPFIDEFVKDVNIDEGKIVVKPIKGMFDEN